MVTGWEMLPETAKALSAPVVKLFEVLAAGCGTVYSPTNIRRTAAAQGDALVIMEEARGRASEVALRAAKRLMDVEARRQINLEAITQLAIEQLPAEVSDTSVEPDWTARFLREAQDIGNEQMQLLWAKLLAGEVAKPGAFSIRSIDIVANMGPAEAVQFQHLCSLIVKVQENIATFISAKMLGEGYVPSLEVMHELQSSGLINFEPMGMHLTLTTNAATGLNIRVGLPDGVTLTALHPSSSTVLPTGVVNLTSAGAELFRIAEWKSVVGYEQMVRDSLTGAGFLIEP